jgi:hypothetical protein
MKKVRNHSRNNRLMYTLIAFGILVVVAIGVYALGAVPNPGHAISELQTCDEGQTLVVQNGEWTCASGSGGVSDVKVTSDTFSGSDFGSYEDMYNWIQNNGCEGYHVCSSTEMQAALQNGLDIRGLFPQQDLNILGGGKGWVNDGPDCYGYAGQENHQGLIYESYGGGKSYQRSCTKELAGIPPRVFCCK